MHDPMVVAFEIHRPWPERRRLVGRRYWPSIVTVWHVEPGGRDSGEVCKHYRREQRPDGTWRTTVLNGWRWHVHHWRIRVGPLQVLRRRLLTRCAWCGGRSRKGDSVNVRNGWGRDGRQRWWRGEIGLHHGDCSSIASAHRSCVCERPVLEHDGYGYCARCGKARAYGMDEARVVRMRERAAIPTGRRR